MSAPLHWANVRESGFVWGMRFLFAVDRLFGRYVFRIALYPVLTFYFLQNRTARKASLTYLARLGQFAPSSGVRANWLTAFRHFIAFAESLTDKVHAWLNSVKPQDVTFHNHAALKALLSERRGAVLLGAHIGNMEVCCALADMRPGLRLNVLVHTQHAEKFNALLSRFRGGSQKVELIQVTQLSPATAILLSQRIEAGEFVAVLADRISVTAADRFVYAPFLGHDAPFPQGPFILAALLQCPVYTLLCAKKNSRFEIAAELFADKIVLPRRDRIAALQQYAALFAQRLEQQCQRTPLQWFNFYPFWKGVDE